MKGYFLAFCASALVTLAGCEICAKFRVENPCGMPSGFHAASARCKVGIGYEQSKEAAFLAVGEGYKDSCEAADEVDYIQEETERQKVIKELEDAKNG